MSINKMFILGEGKIWILEWIMKRPNYVGLSFELREAENFMVMSWLIISMEPGIGKTLSIYANNNSLVGSCERYLNLGNSTQYLIMKLGQRDQTGRKVCHTAPMVSRQFISRM